MNPELQKLAEKLGISEIQLSKLRTKYEREHEELADEKLLSWLEEIHEEIRPKTWLLSASGSSYVIDRNHPTEDGDERHYGYTETPFDVLDAGEAPPPDEIASYRESRDARNQYQTERMAEVEDLMNALATLRAAINAMPAKNKGRAVWALKGRMDALEREIRRRAAA